MAYRYMHGKLDFTPDQSSELADGGNRLVFRPTAQYQVRWSSSPASVQGGLVKAGPDMLGDNNGFHRSIQLLHIPRVAPL